MPRDLLAEKPPARDLFAAQPAPPQPEPEFGITDTWPFRLARGLYGAAKDAATLPGDVYSGRQDVNDPSTASRALNFAGVMTGVNPAVRVGERAIPGVARARQHGAPTREQLKDASTRQFDEFRDSGIRIRGGAVRDFAQQSRQELEEAGITQIDAPDTYAKLKLLESAPEGGFMSAANFHAARKSLNKTAGKFGPDHGADRTAANRLISGLDRFLAGLDETSLVAGTSPGQIARAKGAFGEGRGNFAAYKRSSDLAGNARKAELQAEASNSGQNVGNRLRQRLVSVLTNPKATRGYSKEEVAQMEGVVRGDRATNTARHVGNYLGGGGGLGQYLVSGLSAAGGAAMAGPWGAALGLVPPALGVAAKGLENALVRRSVGKLDEATRARSPLARQGVGGKATDASTRAALVRALMAHQMQNPNQL